VFVLKRRFFILGNKIDESYEGLRYEKREKRRKINRILNMLIIVVVGLIIIFGWKLFFSNNDSTQPVNNTPVTEPENQIPKDNTSTPPEDETAEIDNNANQNPPDEAIEGEDPDDTETPKSESTEHEKVIDGEPESNVIRTIENSAWKPIGTEQSEPHTIKFESGTVDRSEMEEAISYGVGLNKSDINYWWLGRQGDNKVAATISAKNSPNTYRVYIEWVASEGWQPTKIEELKENDSPTYKKQNEEKPDDSEEELD
jgi:hypothetical protein